MSTHTPGPWSVVDHKTASENIYAANGRHIVNVGAHDYGWQPGQERSRDECMANAYLIAAAPEMYEALKEVLASKCPCDAFVKGRKAIAKAEGGIR